jgi:hypothetical protein
MVVPGAMPVVWLAAVSNNFRIPPALLLLQAPSLVHLPGRPLVMLIVSSVDHPCKKYLYKKLWVASGGGLLKLIMNVGGKN